ncbi:MAG: SAM hydrolase/SAM-dependent halogenase family protein [Gemmatimonadaceae bacterium]
MIRRLLVAAIGACLACAPQTEARNPASVLFLTDFGVRDGAVAVCKGVMWEIAPRLHIVDISHEIPPYDIETAGEVIEQALPYYPDKTVVVAVVDPGVGSTRKAIAIRTKKGHLLVGPDNGLFTLVMDAEGLDRAVELTNKRYQRPGDAAYTFHGRDIFSPVGAHLALGVPLDSLGPPVTPVRLDVHPPRRTTDGITGEVRYVEDPYGNVVTNIPAALLDSAGLRVGDSLDVRIGSRSMRLPWRRTFSDVPRGAPLAVMHERGLLSFSLNQGDFARANASKRKDRVEVRGVRPAAP